MSQMALPTLWSGMRSTPKRNPERPVVCRTFSEPRRGSPALLQGMVGSSRPECFECPRGSPERPSERSSGEADPVATGRPCQPRPPTRKQSPPAPRPGAVVCERDAGPASRMRPMLAAIAPSSSPASFRLHPCAPPPSSSAVPPVPLRPTPEQSGSLSQGSFRLRQMCTPGATSERGLPFGERTTSPRLDQAHPETPLPQGDHPGWDDAPDHPLPCFG